MLCPTIASKSKVSQGFYKDHEGMRVNHVLSADVSADLIQEAKFVGDISP